MSRPASPRVLTFTSTREAVSHLDREQRRVRAWNRAVQAVEVTLEALLLASILFIIGCAAWVGFSALIEAVGR